MNQYRITFLGLVISLSVLFISIFFDVDFFERFVSLLHELEHYEVDELIIPLAIFFMFSSVDILKRNRLNKVHCENLKIYTAMMRSTRHILNNFLNQMQLFKLTAEETPNFSPEILALYDEIIDEATRQINALGSVHRIDELSIHEAVTPSAKEK